MGVVSRLKWFRKPQHGDDDEKLIMMMMRARLGMMRLKWVLALLTGHLVKWLLR